MSDVTNQRPFRACDACHRRKVRCIPSSDDPNSWTPGGVCKNCKSASLACTYDTVPQKKGPKGSRAKVISELRERQRRSSISSTITNSTTPPGSPSLSRTSNTICVDLIESCVEFFFAHVHGTQPILERASLKRKIGIMYDDAQAYCLVVSLCAYMLIQPNMRVPTTPLPGSSEAVASSTALGTMLIQDVLEVRKTLDPYENPSVDCVRSSFFLFGSYFCLEKPSTAWAYLREASTLALLLGMHQEDAYRSIDPLEASLKRRLYWLLYVTERAFALQSQRPLTLCDTIDLPDTQQGTKEERERMTGFVHLVQLFKPFDHTFVGLWNQSIETGNAADWIANLQNQLSAALPEYLKSTEVQAVDLKTSQKWLRVMIWQLSISQKLISSNASEEAMTFRYPLELSRQLAQEASKFSKHSMEVHGIGLIKKVFDVACTLIDVMSCVPIEPQSLEIGPRDHLRHFVDLLSKLRGGRDRYLPLLLTKIDETLPGMSNPCLGYPLPSSTMMSHNPAMTDGIPTPDGDISETAFRRVPLLKAEYSDMSETPPFDSQYDEDTAMDSPYSIQPQSSYSG